MAEIITFASGKGGTGKTTVCANVAVAAVEKGKDVTILEADISMANLKVLFGIRVDGATLHEVLSGEAKISEAIYKGPNDVRIVPSGVSLHGVRRADSEKLNGIIDQLSERFDNLLIDAPSGLGPETIIALRKGDKLVLVLTPEIASLSDGLRTKLLAERFDTEPLGVVVSRAYGGEMDISKEEIEEMLEVPVLGIIPEDPEVRRASAFEEPVVIRSPNSPSGKALRELASELFD